MNLLPDKAHLETAREKINHRLMSLVENDKELNLVQILTSYHIDIDWYINDLESITVKAQEDLIKARKNLKDLKRSYDMILDSYGKVRKQETENIRWILKHKNGIK